MSVDQNPPERYDIESLVEEARDRVLTQEGRTLLETAPTAPVPTDGIIHLVTATEREAAVQAEFTDEVHGEALGMLDQAAEIIEERGATGIAIALAHKDGTYGWLLPTQTANMPSLVCAIATMQQALILRTLADDDE